MERVLLGTICRDVKESGGLEEAGAGAEARKCLSLEGGFLERGEGWARLQLHSKWRDALFHTAQNTFVQAENSVCVCVCVRKEDKYPWLGTNPDLCSPRPGDAGCQPVTAGDGAGKGPAPRSRLLGMKHCKSSGSLCLLTHAGRLSCRAGIATR